MFIAYAGPLVEGHQIAAVGQCSGKTAASVIVSMIGSRGKRNEITT